MSAWIPYHVTHRCTRCVNGVTCSTSMSLAPQTPPLILHESNTLELLSLFLLWSVVMLYLFAHNGCSLQHKQVSMIQDIISPRCQSKTKIQFNFVYFIQPNITNYKFSSVDLTVCTHTTSLSQELTSDLSPQTSVCEDRGWESDRVSSGYCGGGGGQEDDGKAIVPDELHLSPHAWHSRSSAQLLQPPADSSPVSEGEVPQVLSSRCTTNRSRSLKHLKTGKLLLGFSTHVSLFLTLHHSNHPGSQRPCHLGALHPADWSLVLIWGKN